MYDLHNLRLVIMILMYFERFGKNDIFYKKGGVEGVSSVGVIVVIDSSCCNHNKNSWRLM